METFDAVEQLCKALRQDKGYWYGWQANIAMAYIDNEHWYRKKNNKVGKYLSRADEHAIANEAADYFLKQITKQEPLKRIILTEKFIIKNCGENKECIDFITL